MTKREKISILKKMRANLKAERLNCFCWAYQVATKKEEHCSETLPRVIALGLRPPRKPYSRDYWYSMYDQETRIRKIDELIKRLSK